MFKRITKFVDGIECLYCEKDGNYYPLRKDVAGTEFVLDEDYFYYVPPHTDLKAALALDAIVEERESYSLSRFYGEARRTYLKNEKPDLYYEMVNNSSLLVHLIDIDKQAIEWEETLTVLMCKNEGVDEALKEKNPMEWVAQMNNIKNRVREIIQRKLIFV